MGVDRFVTTLSISRYSIASSADMNWSRSVSFSILFERMAGVLEQDAVEPFLDLLEFLGVDHDIFGRAFHAGQRLMDHDPRLGRACRLPSAPAVSSTAPIEAHWPMQYVATSQVTNCIVS